MDNKHSFTHKKKERKGSVREMTLTYSGDMHDSSFIISHSLN